MVDTVEVTGKPRLVRADRRWSIFAVVMAGSFMAVVDVAVVNVAVPSVRADLAASFGEAELVIAGYTITYATLLVIGGRLGDLYGRRRIFLIGLAVFTTASAVCGAAPTVEVLIVARAVQGIGGALLFPQVLATVLVAFDGEERARALGIFGSVIGVAAVSGQLIGGLLVDANLFGLSWRPAFLLNVPIGIAAFVAALLVLPAGERLVHPRLDFAGAGLAGLAFVLLVVPLLLGRDLGWPPWLVACLVAALPVMALFLAFERRVVSRGGDPVVHVGLFRHRTLSAGVPIAALFAASYAAFLLLLVFFLQVGLGFSPLHAALVYTPAAVGFLLASLVAHHLVVLHGHQVLLVGYLTAAAGLIGAATTTIAAGGRLHGWELAFPLFVAGIGQGMGLSPLIGTMISGLPPTEAGSASGILTTTLQVGNVLGVATAGLTFFGVLGAGVAVADYARAFAIGLALAAALLLVAALLVGRLRSASLRTAVVDHLPHLAGRFAVSMFLAGGGHIGARHIERAMDRVVDRPPAAADEPRSPAMQGSPNHRTDKTALSVISHD